jgi:hypothetical protein
MQGKCVKVPLLIISVIAAYIFGISTSPQQQQVFAQPEPSINIESILCSEEQQGIVHIRFTISGIEHDSNELTVPVKVISSDGSIVHSANIPIPANAPNPATTLIVFSLPIPEGKYTIQANVGDVELSKMIKVPSCTEPTFNNKGQCISAAAAEFSSGVFTKEQFKEAKAKCKEL